MNYKEEDIEVSSDLILSFKDAQSELLDLYPTGKAFSEKLITCDGLYEWQVDLYPNGINLKRSNRITVCISLKNIKNNQIKSVDAEFSFQIINLDKQRNYLTKIGRRSFVINSLEQDSTFSNSILKETDSNLIISMQIVQFPIHPVIYFEIINKKGEN